MDSTIAVLVAEALLAAVILAVYLFLPRHRRVGGEETLLTKIKLGRTRLGCSINPNHALQLQILLPG